LTLGGKKKAGSDPETGGGWAAVGMGGWALEDAPHAVPHGLKPTPSNCRRKESSSKI